MATTVCPKCKNSIMRGSWEVFTHCPECGAEWNVDPELPAQMLRKICRMAVVYSLLAIVPVIGVVFGLAGAFWGFLAYQRQKMAIGISCMAFAGLVGVIGQPIFTYWGIGRYADNSCQGRLETLSDSIYAYKFLSGKYPPNFGALKEARLAVPEECPAGGGKYYYLAPGMEPDVATQPASSPTSAPASTRAAAATIPVASSVPASGSATTNHAHRVAATGTAPASMPASMAGLCPVCAAAGDDVTGNPEALLVAEVLPGHRSDRRMCVMGDFSVREVRPEDFEALQSQPQNLRFAKGFNKVWTAATKPAKKDKKGASQPATTSAPATASAPATSTAPATTSASAPASASSPVSVPAGN